MTRFRRYLQNTLSISPEESSAVLLSGLLFYLLMTGYYILRPLREEMGLAGGVRDLPKLFLVTLSVMVLATPLFGWLVRRHRPEVFIPLVYRFFAVNILAFYAALQLADGQTLITLGRVFYVWVSVFNLFVMSLFWAFMAGGFGFARSRRVFGIVAIGGTLGAILGSGLASVLVRPLGRHNLLLVSVLFLEAAVRIVRTVSRRFAALDGYSLDAGTGLSESGPGAGAFGGIRLTFGSTYLFGISMYLFLYSLSSTFLYFEQAAIVAAHVTGREARAAIFAGVDFWTNVLTLGGQLFLTGRLLRRLGTGRVLAILPAVTALGFLILGARPTLAVLVLFKVIRSASNYALAKPARETLFTVVDRNIRYKAKSFIDTFVYRGGDALGASAFGLLTAAGLGLAPIAFGAVPLGIVWAGVGVYLGRRQRGLVQPPEKGPAAPTPDH